MPSRPLTPKQDMFCQEYLVDLNATQAAIRAGYSEKTAQEQSSRLLSNAMVSVRIAELATKRTEQIGVTAERVLGELERLAMCDVGDAFDSQGALLPLRAMPIDVRRCISGIEVEEIWEGRGADRKQIGELKKIKFWDKKGSLDSLGRYLKLFIDKVEHSADDSLAAIIAGTPRKP